MKYRLLLLQTILLILLTAISNGQTERYDEAWRLVHFTTESGLPSNHVTGVVETSRGTIWVATSRGLAWYDGFRWHPIDTSLGLPQAFPASLSSDTKGRILTIINKKLFRGNEYGFTLIATGNIINATSFNGDDILIHMNSSLYLFHNDSIQLFSPSLNITKGKTSFTFFTSGKNIWILTPSGLYRWETGSWICKIPSLSFPIITKYLDENENGTGIAAIGSPGHYIGLWEWNKNEKPHFVPEENAYEAKTIAMRNNGDLVLLLQSGDVKIRHKGTWTNFNLLQYQLTNIEQVRYRPNGDLWIATANGLYLYKLSSTRWTYLNHISPDPKNNITEILQTTKGDLWIGSANGVEIRKKDGSTETIHQIQQTLLYSVTGLAEDNDGNIWISSGGSFEGAFRWDGHEWTHIPITDDSDGVMIHKIKKDRNGRLWFLGLSKKQGTSGINQPGAFVLDHGKFTHWGISEGLINGRVYAFAEGEDSSYWFGTYGGISRWKPSKPWEHNQNGTWKHWTEQEGLLSNNIFTLTIGHNNRLWFGDRSHGLGYIDEQEQLHYLTTEEGLISDDIWDISMDSSGKIWSSTRQGVSSFQQGIFSNFDIKNGLTPITCWPILATNNKIYIGTQGNGVATLNLPGENTPIPQVIINKPLVEPTAAFLRWKTFSFWQEESPQDIQIRYRIDGKQWSSWNTERELSLANLDPGSYSFEVQAKSLFGNFSPIGEKVFFTIEVPLYRHPLFLTPAAISILGLIMLSINQSVTKRRHTEALHLSESKFRRLTEATFEGIIIHDNGTILDANTSTQKMFGYDFTEFKGNSMLYFFTAESQEIITRNLSLVSETPYEAEGRKKDGTKIFVEIMGKFIPYENRRAIVVAIRDITERKRIEKQLAANHQQLQSLASELSFTEERERRQMATYLHDYIGQSLALCKIKLTSLLRLYQDKKLEEVQTILNQMISNTQTLTFELSPPILYELEFDDAVEWLTKQIMEQHHIIIHFKKDVQTTPLRQELRVLLFNAIRELLVNVIKHAEVTQATLVVQRNNGNIFICVEDDGVGFSPAALTNRSTRKGGFGLFNIRERLKLFGGKFEIESRPYGGTKATLLAPLNDSNEQKKDNNS